VNAKTRELALRLDKARREQIAGSTLTRREIRRQFLDNGLSVEQIVSLTGYRPSEVRMALRGLPGGYDFPAPLKPQDRGKGRRSLALPAKVKVAPDACFTCEIVDEGILYRRVEGECAA
jgi:hypothetical protein